MVLKKVPSICAVWELSNRPPLYAGIGNSDYMNVRVMPARNSHLSEILDIWKEFMDFHEDLDPFFTRKEDAHISFSTHLHDSLQSEDIQILVAVGKGKVIAYSIAEIHQHAPVLEKRTYGFISDLAVRPDYRRKGTGALLLSEMLAWFKSKGLSRIEVNVVVKNMVALSFWKKHGFQEYMHILYLKNPDQD